jgi:electron transport complex protein RnfD
MSEPMLLTGGGNIWILAVAGLGGVILLKQKQGYWETPVLFMSVCFACEALSGSREAPPAFFSGVLLMSFFFLADPVTLPLTRKGTALFILGAAFLSSRLSPEGFSIRSTGYAVLLMNLLTPWLDIWIRPVPYKTKGSLKATYPI